MSFNRKYATAAGLSAITAALIFQYIFPSKDNAQEQSTTPPATPIASTQPMGLQGSNQTEHVQAASPAEAGRYLVKIAGCNDCHTPEWMESSGNVPEEKWLTGVPVGFKGPWGTSYASNLRLYVRDFTPDLWVQVLRARNTRPPMPWASLHAMSDADLRAIHAYLVSMGPAGQPTPQPVPPTQEPKTPYFYFVPQMPAGTPTGPNPEPAEQSGPRR